MVISFDLLTDKQQLFVLQSAECLDLEEFEVIHGSYELDDSGGVYLLEPHYPQ